MAETAQRDSALEQIQALEQEIFEATAKLNELRKQTPGEPVANYEFSTLGGNTSLLELFGDKDKLLMIHNMGQACRYCTLWADGFNGFLPHLEDALSVVLVSKDAPDVQRQFANARGWRFRLASHGGGAYMTEQVGSEEFTNMPGAAVYERHGDTITRTNGCAFGPGDLYCSAWNLLALAGVAESDWTPQYNYWRRPEQMEDGGANLRD